MEKSVLLVFYTIGNTRVSWRDGRCSVSCRAFNSGVIKKNYVRTIVNQITRSYLILSWQVFRVEFFLYIPFDSKALSQKEYIRKNSTREPCNVKKEYRVGWVKKRLSPRWIITRNLPNAHSLSFQSVSKLVKTIKITRNFINQLKVLNSVIIQGLREPSPWIISTSGNTTLISIKE